MDDNIKPLHSGRRNALDIAGDPVVVKVLDVTEEGLVLQGDSGLPTVGRMSREVAQTPPELLAGSEVLVVFAGGDPAQPIAIAVLQPFGNEVAAEETAAEQAHLHSVVDDEHVILNAKRKVELRCGKGSITITPDGKIILRGTHLLSRSSGPLRIKGGHVDIN